MKPTLAHEKILAAQERFLQLMLDGAWRNAKEIKSKIGVTRDMMRAMPLWEDGGILALPDRGFCLTAFASAEDRRHCLATMRSRSAEINKRADAIAAAA